MSDQGKPTLLISPENLQTVVAVGFVLALLGVAFNMFNFTQLSRYAAQTKNVVDRNTVTDATVIDRVNELSELEKSIMTLQERVDKLEGDTHAHAATPAEPAANPE